MTVTVPVLAVEPAAMVSVFAEDSVKSPATAFAPAVAATVRITSADDRPLSVAVTVLELPAPLSLTVSGFDASGSDNASVTVGVASSSVIVPVPLAVDMAAFTDPLKLTTTVSFASSRPIARHRHRDRPAGLARREGQCPRTNRRVVRPRCRRARPRIRIAHRHLPDRSPRSGSP